MPHDAPTGTEPDYLRIVRHYEDCLRRHGDTHRGVDWPDAADAARRYRVMLDIIGQRPCPSPPELLDVGCGAGHLLEHLRRAGSAARYAGIDLSAEFVALCRRKFPAEHFLEIDLLRSPGDNPRADFVIANGVFTEKRDLSWDSMWDYARRMIRVMYDMARVGIAFNVMSTHVDWQRDDLFHLPCDTLAAFLTAEVSRHHVLRADYGLYEYTAYVFREPA
jgi:SAM-dependent methyltransferase